MYMIALPKPFSSRVGRSHLSNGYSCFKATLVRLIPILLSLLSFHSLIGTTNTGLVSAASTKSKSKTKIDTKPYADICVESGKPMYVPLKDNDGRGHAILKLAIQLSTLASVTSKDSPQHKAMCWMIFDDPRKLDPRGNRGRFIDRYTLVTFYVNTKGPGWVRSDYWLTKEHECNWYGVSCGRPGIFSLGTRVVGLDLSFNKVSGLIPRELAYLSELRVLDLNGNELQGVVPHLILASLTKLEKLHLHMNDLFGYLPPEIGLLKNLKELTLFGNFFLGPIPAEISNLKNLKVLDLYANNLTGNIPSAIGKMKSLKELYVNDNDLQGRMPKEICNLHLQGLTADCLGTRPEVPCDCCLICCQGLPDPKCKDMRAKPVTSSKNSSNNTKKKTSSSNTAAKQKY